MLCACSFGMRLSLGLNQMKIWGLFLFIPHSVLILLASHSIIYHPSSHKRGLSVPAFTEKQGTKRERKMIRIPSLFCVQHVLIFLTLLFRKMGLSQGFICSLHHRSAIVIDLEAGPGRKEKAVLRTGLHLSPARPACLTESWNFPVTFVAYACWSFSMWLVLQSKLTDSWREKTKLWETPSSPKTSLHQPTCYHVLFRIRKTYTQYQALEVLSPSAPEFFP